MSALDEIQHVPGKRRGANKLAQELWDALDEVGYLDQSDSAGALVIELDDRTVTHETPLIGARGVDVLWNNSTVVEIRFRDWSGTRSE